MGEQQPPPTPAKGGPRRRAATAVRAVPLSPEAWSPFGWLPVEDADAGDRAHRLRFEWDDAHVNFIGHDAAEVRREGTRLRCSEMYRHDTHTQALLVVDAPAVIAVAPAGHSFRGPPDAEAVRAFLLEPGDAVVLHRGTWHWGPYPRRASHVRLFNLQGLRYAEDNTRADLDAAGAAVEVRLPAGEG